MSMIYINVDLKSNYHLLFLLGACMYWLQSMDYEQLVFLSRLVILLSLLTEVKYGSVSSKKMTTLLQYDWKRFLLQHAQFQVVKLIIQ